MKITLQKEVITEELWNGEWVTCSHGFKDVEYEISDEQIIALGKKYFQLVCGNQVQLPNNKIYAPELYQGCVYCDRHEQCPDAFCSHAVNCGAYGKGDADASS